MQIVRLIPIFIPSPELKNNSSIVRKPGRWMGKFQFNRFSRYIYCLFFCCLLLSWPRRLFASSFLSFPWLAASAFLLGWFVSLVWSTVQAFSLHAASSSSNQTRWLTPCDTWVRFEEELNSANIQFRFAFHSRSLLPFLSGSHEIHFPVTKKQKSLLRKDLLIDGGDRPL